ncbi:MAG: acyl-CoA thioesterase [Deltaproteobacteria bacterium]|nr:acyl-CoA thioesterase [Deltaproteobacteria bacterium]
MRSHGSTFAIYFDDLDLFSILHNARYLLFMERALGEFWKKLGWGTIDATNADHAHLVRRNELDHLRPFVGVGQVRVRLRIEKLDTTSCVVAHTVMPVDDDEPCATGRRVIVCIDPITRRPATWSAVFRERLGRYLAPHP